MRLLAGFLLALWLIGGLVLTLRPAHPLPGQVVDDNLIPFHTLGIYLDNLGSEFWMRNLFGNLALLLPLGLLGPIALPALDRWWRIAIPSTPIGWGAPGLTSPGCRASADRAGTR